MRSQKGKVSSAVLFVLSVLIIGGLLGGAGYWYGKKNASKETQSSAAKQTTSDASETKNDTVENAATSDSKQCSSSVDPKTFYDKVIGLQFCYPKEWGEATVGNVPASASEKGSAYDITFSKKPLVAVSSATSDYVNTIGRDVGCADPVSKGPDFSALNTNWKVTGELGDIQMGTRGTIKKDGVYMATETVNDFGGKVCLVGLVNVPGGAYTLITVSMQAVYGNGISTVKAHVDNPNILITPAERVQFGELLDSIARAS